jgi:hypothetical protein
VSAEEFLGVWLVLTIVAGYLGLVALFCGGCIRLIRWVDSQKRNADV